MGHLMVPTMEKIQRALGLLTLAADGVDGRGIYIYGEAWDFGEVSIDSEIFSYLSSSGCTMCAVCACY